MQSDLMWLWSPLTGADHRELTALLYRLVSHTHTDTRITYLCTHDRKYRSTNTHEMITCNESAYLLSSLDAGSFSTDSYWGRYSPVMNPGLRFLLHIPGRCQGPHRRQRSLPKSQPCYTDECVCPVLWSRLSSSMCLCVHLCMFSLCACLSLPLFVFFASYVVIPENEIKDECEISVLCMQVQLSLVYIPLHRVGCTPMSIVTILILC